MLLEEVLLLQEKFKLTVEQHRQNEILRRDAEQAVKDQRELNELQTRGQAELQISRNDPSRQLESAVAGFGFFADSAALQIEQMEEMALKTSLYEAELKNLQDRLEELNTLGVDKDDARVMSLNKQYNSLKDTLSLYTELQPRIDEAALAQQRFNDAFAITMPVMTSVVNGLNEVVQGTKSAEEAFSDFLKTIGQMLIQEGTKMIAMYVAIGIAKAFAGMGSSTPTIGTDTNYFSQGFNPMSYFGGRATGGPTRPNGTYLVGEQGPELLTMGNQSGYVHSNTSEAMDRYRAGGSSGGGNGKLDVNYNVTSNQRNELRHRGTVPSRNDQSCQRWRKDG